MSKILLVSIIILAAGLLLISSGKGLSAQDCERVIEGNTQSPCKRLDYLDGIQPPRFLVKLETNDRGEYHCQAALRFESTVPLDRDTHIGVYVGHGDIRPPGKDFDLGWFDSIHTPARRAYEETYPPESSWYDRRYSYGPPRVSSDMVEATLGGQVRLNDPVPTGMDGVIYNFVLVHAWMKGHNGQGEYRVKSEVFDRPQEVADYQLLMNQCLGDIARQLEQEATVETARQQAEADRIAAETAVQEAESQAEIASIELQSAQDALNAQEALNAALLTETILAIKREDAIRAAWQQVILVRMAGLEERTVLWNEAVQRWAAEDFQFSTAMQARIQGVERLQALNAALEQSMADQRQLLIAQLEDLERAERDAQENRNPETEPASGPETGG